MEARKLKTLLRTLQEFGVSSYRDADVTLQLGAVMTVPDRDVEGEIQLPPGTPDPREAIRKLYEKHGQKPPKELA